MKEDNYFVTIHTLRYLRRLDKMYILSNVHKYLSRHSYVRVNV